MTQHILVVGAGIMGAGIAQVAAQAGHPVMLHDARDGAAVAAKDKLATTLQGLVAKGKLAADEAEATLSRITPIRAAEEAASAGLVVEAIVENLDAKRAIFKQLEGIVSADCVLATNTSSISVTAIANGLQHPGRLVGMHFFNPVPLMKLVEVVSGLHTDPAVAEAVFALGKAWGKVPVHTKSTPGFIVNRIARPYYAEALALLLEQAATPAVLDACLRGAGFRMGPCELMDLIGHDTNFAVTNSVYDANFQDKRYLPSLVQREMVDGGLLGRKSGRGFYRYPAGAATLPVAVHEAPATAREVTVHGDGPIADHLEAAATQALAGQGWGPARLRGTGWTGLVIDGAHLVMSTGRTAGELAADLRHARVAVFDRIAALPCAPGTALAYAVAESADASWRTQAGAWLAALGFAPLPVADTPGLIAARTLAMLINEAADAVLQGVCTPEGADAAMKLGVNYPAGPFEWLARWDGAEVVRLLDALDAHYRGERYRVSPWLRRRSRSNDQPPPCRSDPMTPAFICDAIRTPFGRYGGALSSVRADDLGAVPLKALMARNPGVDWAAVTDVLYGCANQAGEDNRNVARMAALLAGLPQEVPGATLNRLCGSGMDAVGTAARAIKAGEAQLMIAGGVESMSRAPFVMPKADTAFSRANAVYDTTIGWRFVNKRMKELYGVDSMPETAENVATDFRIEREAQDRLALRSQLNAVAAQQAGHLAAEITPVSIAQKKGDALVVDTDEHPRATSLEALARLKGVVRPDGTVTAGNASGVNDGACALILASEAAAARYGLTPRARVVGMATAGLAPRIMGFGPAPATRKVLELTGLSLAQMDVIELNEAFAAQGLAVLRDLGLPDDDPRVNRWGGAIALGHPLGASGARLVTTAVSQLHRLGGRYALCTMCIGVGQGIAIVLERA